MCLYCSVKCNRNIPVSCTYLYFTSLHLLKNIKFNKSIDNETEEAVMCAVYLSRLYYKVGVIQSVTDSRMFMKHFNRLVLKS